MKYRVGVKEVWEQMYEVEANSVEQAMNKLERDLYEADTEGVAIIDCEFEFDHTLEKEDWVVYEEDE